MGLRAYPINDITNYDRNNVKKGKAFSGKYWEGM